MNEKLKKLFLNQNQFWPYLVILILASLIALGVELMTTADESTQNNKGSDPLTADTFIPKGYVLVPVEIANHEALHSLLGQHGVVDLFLPGTNKNQRPIRLARQIKLLRAPLNPHRFAVLAKESESVKFVRIEEPLFAVINNPKHRSTVKQVEERKQRRKIFIEMEAPET